MAYNSASTIILQTNNTQDAHKFLNDIFCFNNYFTYMVDNIYLNGVHYLQNSNDDCRETLSTAHATGAPSLTLSKK